MTLTRSPSASGDWDRRDEEVLEAAIRAPDADRLAGGPTPFVEGAIHGLHRAAVGVAVVGGERVPARLEASRRGRQTQHPGEGLIGEGERSIATDDADADGQLMHERREQVSHATRALAEGDGFSHGLHRGGCVAPEPPVVREPRPESRACDRHGWSSAGPQGHCVTVAAR